MDYWLNLDTWAGVYIHTAKNTYNGAPDWDIYNDPEVWKREKDGTFTMEWVLSEIKKRYQGSYDWIMVHALTCREWS